MCPYLSSRHGSDLPLPVPRQRKWDKPGVGVKRELRGSRAGIPALERATVDSPVDSIDRRGRQVARKSADPPSFPSGSTCSSHQSAFSNTQTLKGLYVQTSGLAV